MRSCVFVSPCGRRLDMLGSQRNSHSRLRCLCQVSEDYRRIESFRDSCQHEKYDNRSCGIVIDRTIEEDVGKWRYCTAQSTVMLVVVVLCLK